MQLIQQKECAHHTIPDIISCEIIITKFYNIYDPMYKKSAL